MTRQEQLKLGKRLARRYPAPDVRDVNGTNVVVHKADGLTADELLALSEFYRVRYGKGA